MTIFSALTDLAFRVVVSMITSIIILLLWNWVAVSIFNIRAITYIETLGLYWLLRLLLVGDLTFRDSSEEKE